MKLENEQIKFCPICGTTIKNRSFGHPSCPNDHFVWYQDPKVAVGALVKKNEKLLLVKRKFPPHINKWSYPSGFVDAGEKVEDAARREVLEETNINVEIEKLLGVYSSKNNDTIYIAYSANALDNHIVTGSESLDASWFEVNKLPSLAFKHDQKILQRWKDLYWKNS
ncbi:MAG: DNA mismatch repair protein MutT [Chloroflexi bacterium]|nr:DNA mismatch repair protein MutT [Chloroflexota bacterium]|tara:strand:+ start:2757 stop:3257 length:501 start_codon:yes stop_codon:yes gene_type:complete